MPAAIKKGSKGADVKLLQRLLNERGYTVDVDGDFGPQTYRAVRAFQSQNLDQLGQPLVIDGEVGPLTWWSLTHKKPVIITPSAIDYAKAPPAALGGSKIGRAALKVAIDEMNSGAGEIGGNNKGKWVRKYLKPTGIDEGNSWCASFVSWCFLQAGGGNRDDMPFRYSPGARDILSQLQKKGFTRKPEEQYQPLPGDLVIWWREKLAG